jgi:uncharacterized protein (TIGR00661 family)
MNILFAVQGTGNGHVSRARDVYPELCKYGNVDVLVSGIQADVELPFPVKYRLYGMSFIFGKKGGVDIFQTIKRLNLVKLIKDIRTIPINQYDLIINDFEPVSAWACKLKRISCIGLSHQSAVLNERAPQPQIKDLKGELVLKHYAPVTDYYGFHFKAYGANIFTPVIRSQIREMQPDNLGHYTVYLPAYDDVMLLKHLSQFSSINWQVFSKHNKQPLKQGNVSIQPIHNDTFIKSMATSTGVLCGAGFEGPAEALYLGKKLLVVPMHDQYEQQCNAAALAEMGVPVIKQLSAAYYSIIEGWLADTNVIKVDYPDQTAHIIAELIKAHAYVAFARNKDRIPVIAS